MQGCVRSLRASGFLGAVLLTLLASLAPTAAAQDPEATLQFNEDFLGIVSVPLDQDLVAFEEVEGSQLTIDAKRTGKSNLAPKIELLDENLAVLAVGTLKKSQSKIAKFAAPYSGTYLVRISSANGSTGNYRLRVRGKPPTKYEGAGSIAAPGEIDSLEFVAREDAVLSGTVKRAGGGALEPTLIEVEDPLGALVAVAGKFTLNAAGNTLTFKDIVLPRLGDYELRITGQNATAGDYTFKYQVKNPKPVKGKVYEDEFPNNPGPTGPGFRLDEVFFARGVRSQDGLSLEPVSPLTTVKTNPISGLPIPGTLQGLYPTVSVGELAAFELGPFYGPPIVPRNAVLVLRFTAPVDIDSLVLDGDERLTADSPIQLTVNGVTVPIEVFVAGKDVILNPVTGNEIGFPPSPVVVNSFGHGVGSTLGSAQLSLDPVNGAPVLSKQGGGLKPRPDLLGSPAAGGQPIGFNPGNQVLDFVEQASAGVTELTFNGFLPDLDQPRVVREYRFDGTFTPANGDAIGFESITLTHNAPFSNLAKNGAGEWAQGILRLRPNGPNTEIVVIESSTTTNLGGGSFITHFVLASAIQVPLAAGQEWQLARAEFYEPDPANPLDPQLFDPNNPLLLENKDLANFLEVIDPDGTVLDPTSGVPSDASIAMRFSEAMDVDSAAPYESFYVSEMDGSTNPGVNNIGRTLPGDGGRRIEFAPEREIQFGPDAGTVERIGFGSTPRALALHVRVVPAPDVLTGLLGANGFQDFQGLGIKGVTDVAGRPVAVPLASFSPAQPFAELVFPFETLGDLSLDDFGAVVHRFQGAPKTGVAADGTPGVTFADVPETITAPNGNVYGPRIADVNLFANGFLAGAPVTFIQKVHDNFNPPNDGQFSPFAFGTSTPIGGFAVQGGARMQHVFRAQDASPDSSGLAGTLLHLRQVWYAPIGGFVQNTVIPDFQVHGGHSRRVPITAQGGGIPQNPESGLGFAFAGNYDATNPESGQAMPRQLLAGTQNSPTSFTGVTYTINNQLRYQPPGSGNYFHPMPDQPFNNFLPYDNGAIDPQTSPGGNGTPQPHALLLEYRVRGQPPGAIATGNGFTFNVAIATTALPRFRVYTIGAGCSSCCVGGLGQCFNFANCVTAFGPAIQPPLEPDTMVNAAGPVNPIAGSNCICPRHPTTPPTVPPFAPANCALSNTGTATTPTIANGAQTPTGAGVNYGDNSRYFMIFDYVKLHSRIRSPWVQVQPSLTVPDPQWLAPIFDPPLNELPAGTVFDIRFRASVDGAGTGETAFVTPEQMADENTNPMNIGPNRQFIQFEVTVESDVTTQLQPAMDTIVIPFRK